MMSVEVRHTPSGSFEPYRAIPDSKHRAKLSFRVDFNNGGHLEAEGFLLDIPGDSLSPIRAAEIIVSAMNLLRAGPVSIRSLEVVLRGDHDDRS